MQRSTTEIITYYATMYGEKDRFTRDRAHTIEYLTTLRYLERYLPHGCHVLDCCAGPGAYAFALAEMGYRVTAGDLVAEHVDMLNERNRDAGGILERVYQGDVLDMNQFADDTFDAVLCMGALYHLFDEADRQRCIAECLRVLRRGGLFVFAYINRNGVYINHVLYNEGDADHRNAVLETGHNGVFYTMDFGEPAQLVDGFPLERLADVGVDGLIYPLKDALNAMDDEMFDSYMAYHFATCEQPSIIGHSMHGLWIGRKA